MKSPACLILTLFALTPLAHARVFTDDAGRQVEAELVGVRGDHVVISSNGRAGRWPIAKLSTADQAYVRDWQKNPPATPKLTVRLFERDGIGPAGAFKEEGPPGIPKNIPGIRQTEESAKYKHYEADITNPSQVDANHLTMAYVLYIIEPDGKVTPQSGSTPILTIAAGARTTATTQGVTYVRAKTKTLTLGTNPLGGLTTGTSTDRTKERFGGAWIRVYAPHGALVTEAQKLHPEVARLKPAWTGATAPSEPPVLSALDALGEFIKNLPKLPGLPPPPKPPGFPPKPPGL